MLLPELAVRPLCRRENPEPTTGSPVLLNTPAAVWLPTPIVVAAMLLLLLDVMYAALDSGELPMRIRCSAPLLPVDGPCSWSAASSCC